jgi:hypothetical protein
LIFQTYFLISFWGDISYIFNVNNRFLTVHSCNHNLPGAEAGASLVYGMKNNLKAKQQQKQK